MIIPQVPVQPERTGELAGAPVVLGYGSVAAEYAALRQAALMVDRGFRLRMRIEGARAREMINGLVTNDIAALSPGQGAYAAALTAKGKIIADVRIFASETSLLIDAPPRAAAGWGAMLRKFINPRLAPYSDVSASTGDIGVFGVAARKIVSGVTGVAAETLAAFAPYSHVTVTPFGSPIIVARVPDLGLEGYELFTAGDGGATIRDRLLDAGATPGGLDAWEIARIEAGRPEWGVEIDDGTLVQEANLDELHAVSYTKGCYVGQETVARVHFRGHVNRHLRGLRFVCPEPPPVHAALIGADGKPAGDVRSAAISPRLGGIAIGMIRREVEIGTALTATWSGGECRADVCFLPFAL
ncbi:MAG: YgfZ/GcvT domain-containing protein [Gemmatimonadaceae bacterium]